MTRPESRDDILDDGDIVYFDYLHLHSARRSNKPSHKDQHFHYEVEGKARPAIVNGSLWKNSSLWYRIFLLTTKGRDETGRVKKPFIRIGNLLEGKGVSYVSRDPEWYPTNLVSMIDGQIRIVRKLDRLELGNLMKLITFQECRS